MYNAFSSLNVFNDARLNTYLDTIYSAIANTFGEGQLPIVCGSVAKVMQGVYSDNYLAKDIDLVIESWQVHRYLEQQLPLIFPADGVEVRPERVILFTSFIAIVLATYPYLSYCLLQKYHKILCLLEPIPIPVAKNAPALPLVGVQNPSNIVTPKKNLSSTG